eukprot:c315_g1_i1.p2 GENE.c315_g1_i1~~c315_g1_i1.p2  ORF type:complete len:185 (-),score=45.95 c315_g1_i1:413-922(-)
MYNASAQHTQQQQLPQQFFQQPQQQSQSQQQAGGQYGVGGQQSYVSGYGTGHGSHVMHPHAPPHHPHMSHFPPSVHHAMQHQYPQHQSQQSQQSQQPGLQGANRGMQMGVSATMYQPLPPNPAVSYPHMPPAYPASYGGATLDRLFGSASSTMPPLPSNGRRAEEIERR